MGLYSSRKSIQQRRKEGLQVDNIGPENADEKVVPEVLSVEAEEPAPPTKPKPSTKSSGKKTK